MRFNLLKHNNLMLRSERRERLEAWAASDSPISHSQYWSRRPCGGRGGPTPQKPRDAARGLRNLDRRRVQYFAIVREADRAGLADALTISRSRDHDPTQLHTGIGRGEADDELRAKACYFGPLNETPFLAASLFAVMPCMLGS
jgi:hypothetical protein